jgi:hypothetical protein
VSFTLVLLPVTLYCQKRSALLEAMQGLAVGSLGCPVPQWFQGYPVAAHPLLIWLPRTVYLQPGAGGEQAEGNGRQAPLDRCCWQGPAVQMLASRRC